MRSWVLGLLLSTAPLQAAVETRHVEGDLYEASFSYSPQIGVTSVHLAGSFNGWSKTETPMRDPDGDGVYRASLRLTQGRYSYKFVMNGTIWMADPGNPSREADGFEGFNSVVAVGGAGSSPAAAARLGDGEVVSSSVRHGPGIEFREWVPRENAAVLRLRTAHKDVEAVSLLTAGRRHALKHVYTKDAHDIWETVLESPAASFRYSFELRDGKKTFRLGAGGLSARPSRADHFEFDKSSAPRLETPDWAADAVFYQIFPERFFNADRSNDPEGVRPWGGVPELFNFFGGDLEGIIRKLPYLEDLGVTALYLNPVFEAPTNHKYDTADYGKIDPHFGDDAVFDRLIREARKRGIRILLDGVFNHSGDLFWAFRDVEAKGARSKFKDWYAFKGFPVEKDPPNYECWWGFSHLPKLDTDNPEVRAHLLEVGERWIRKGAAGWRLDVPNEVPHAFWKEFRKRVRKAGSDAYIVGEIWTDGRPWLKGDEFDAVMNYTFRSHVLNYFGSGKIGLGELHRGLAEQRHSYPRSSLPVQFNLLGSHDTRRVLTVFDKDIDRLKLAVFFQMTYLGAPVIYYGDEIGLEGEKDPDCRRCFPWEPEAWDRGLRGHYRRLIRIRKSLPELRRGSFKGLLVDEERDIYVYLREHRGERAVIALHRSPKPARIRLKLPAPLSARSSLRDLYSGARVRIEDGFLVLDLGPYQGLILKP